MNLRQEGCWDQHYSEELKNFKDHGDEGDVWFGEPLTRKIINRILKELNVDPSQESRESVNIIDLGCGNSFLLCSLVERLAEQSTSERLDRFHLHGIDYSANSIELSEKIVESRNLNHIIHLKQCDILDHEQIQQTYNETKFGVIVDKGTFDAICLLSDDNDNSNRVKYAKTIQMLSKDGTIFILASCNHTESELLTMMTFDAVQYTLIGRIETPKIMFGGKEGSQVCCLVFKFTSV